MLKASLYILLITVLTSCESNPASTAESRNDNAKEIAQDKTPKSDSINAIQGLLPILNKISPSDVTETNNLIKLNSDSLNRSFATALNLDSINSIYRYNNYTILEYSNSRWSREAFYKLTDLIEESISTKNYTPNSIKSAEGFALYYDIMSKSGSIFILYQSFIIHRLRNCRENFNDQNQMELNLLDALFAGNYPDNKYFIRSCCSCPKDRLVIK